MEKEKRSQVIKTLYEFNPVNDEIVYSEAYDYWKPKSIKQLKEACKMYGIDDHENMKKDNLIMVLIEHLTISKIVFN